jgi:hypothetical protein
MPCSLPFGHHTATPLSADHEHLPPEYMLIVLLLEQTVLQIVWLSTLSQSTGERMQRGSLSVRTNTSLPGVLAPFIQHVVSWQL